MRTGGKANNIYYSTNELIKRKERKTPTNEQNKQTNKQTNNPHPYCILRDVTFPWNLLEASSAENNYN